MEHVKTVLVFPQFKPVNLRLQPWLTAYQVGIGLQKQGHEVLIITDCDSSEEINGIQIRSVSSLRGSHSKLVCGIIQSINPDNVIVSVTPLSLVTARWYEGLKKYKSYAFLSYPFYSSNEMLRAFPYLNSREIVEYGRHLLVPNILWSRQMTGCFQGVICQSRKTAAVISTKTKFKIPVFAIPPGICKETWFPAQEFASNHAGSNFLYVGTASNIRGFSVLLDAFSKLTDPGIRLTILARRADEQKLTYIDTELARRGLAGRVTVKGGWLEIADLRKEIHSADAVLMPFVLVPSELPVSVMESIACGTPVVITDIDGLPDAAGDAGVVIPNGDSSSLVSAILKIHKDKQKLQKLTEACAWQREQMMSWESVTAKWHELLSE